MSVPRTIPFWVQLVVKGTYAGDNWVFTHNYAATTTFPPSGDQLAAFASAWWSAYGAHMRAIANTGVAFLQVVATSRYPSVPNTQGIFSIPGGTFGTLTGVQIPGNVTGSLTKYDGFTGRENRNRNFFLPAVEDQVVANQNWSAALVNTITIFAQDLLTAYISGTLTLAPVAASFKGQFLRLLSKVTVWAFLRSLRLRVADEHRTRRHHAP